MTTVRPKLELINDKSNQTIMDNLKYTERSCCEYKGKKRAIPAYQFSPIPISRLEKKL